MPDATIVGLSNALANTPMGSVLGPVREMVEIESEERYVRNKALAPIVALCRPGRRVGRLIFPSRVLRRLWLGLNAQSPDLVAQARSMELEEEPDIPMPLVFDAICAVAGEGMRARSNPDFTAAAEICDAALPSGANAMAACLDLAPVVREALPHLQDWIRRMDETSATQMRLAFRDATTLSSDAGPKFVEMLSARLEAPWQTMRLISTVMDRPSEAYLASSEMGVLTKDVLADIDAQLAVVRALDLNRSPPQAARAAAQAVHNVTSAIAGFTESVALNREGPMGSRIAEQRTTLAALVETKLSAIDNLVAAVLPLESVRFAGRMTKLAPRLTHDPDSDLLLRAKAGLIFAAEVRPAAASGGFGSTRTKALEAVNDRLATYTDDLVDYLRSEDPGDIDRARLYLEAAADLLALSSDEKAAQIVRRRAAA